MLQSIAAYLTPKKNHMILPDDMTLNEFVIRNAKWEKKTNKEKLKYFIVSRDIQYAMLPDDDDGILTGFPLFLNNFFQISIF